MPGMGSLRVVIDEPFADLAQSFPAGFKCLDVKTLVFQWPPQAFDHAIVDPAATTVHGDFHIGVLQNLGKFVAGELVALIRVEDFRWPVFG
jgi:hypothetical protein